MRIPLRSRWGLRGRRGRIRISISRYCTLSSMRMRERDLASWRLIQSRAIWLFLAAALVYQSLAAVALFWVSKRWARSVMAAVTSGLGVEASRRSAVAMCVEACCVAPALTAMLASLAVAVIEPLAEAFSYQAAASTRELGLASRRSAS